MERFGVMRKIKQVLMDELLSGRDSLKTPQKQENQGNKKFSKWAYDPVSEWENFEIDEDSRSFSGGLKGFFEGEDDIDIPAAWIGEKKFSLDGLIFMKGE